MIIRKKPHDPVVLFTFAINQGLALAGNKVTIQTLAALPVGTFYYDLKLFFAGNTVATYLTGTIRAI